MAGKQSFRAVIENAGGNDDRIPVDRLLPGSFNLRTFKPLIPPEFSWNSNNIS
jgi:hypothetical protein